VVTIAAIFPVAGAAQDPQRPIIRTGVELIVVDVQVVDRTGYPETTLKPEDFEVTLDGDARRVVSAELVRHTSANIPGARTGQRPAAARGGDAADEGRRFILAIDEHSFHPVDARAAMHTAERFIAQLQPDDLIGLYTYPTGAVQAPLTNDHAAVRRALDGVTGLLMLPTGPYTLSPAEIMDIASGDTEALGRVARRECSAGDVLCSRDIRNQAISAAGYLEAQVAQSLAGLRNLFDGLKQLEGRKTLVIVSGGLFTSDRGMGRVNMASEIQQVGRLAAGSNTNIYVLHMDASFLRAFSQRRGPSVVSLMRDSGTLAAGLEMLSGAAGGALFRIEAGTGDWAFQRVLRESAVHYLLGVQPLAEDRDGESHAIRVRVKDRELIVRSRTQVIIPKSGA
jgi:VWFA-related protein